MMCNSSNKWEKANNHACFGKCAIRDYNKYEKLYEKTNGGKYKYGFE
jgi:hypothetical protein